MLTFDRVIVILRKFFIGRRFFCLATTCTIFQRADKSIIFLPCICYLENISRISAPPPPYGDRGVYTWLMVYNNDYKYRTYWLVSIIVLRQRRVAMGGARMRSRRILTWHACRRLLLCTANKRMDLEASMFAYMHVANVSSPVNFRPNPQRPWP